MLTAISCRERTPGAWICLVVAALCVPPSVVAAQEAPDGRRLYDEACAGCHGRNGQETARGQARRLDILPEDAVRDYFAAARAIAAPARPYQRLKQGLNDAEVEALVGYIATFHKP